MTTIRKIRRLLATVLLLAAIGAPAELGVMTVVASPAHALSCKALANAMFHSRHRAVYWAQRYAAAGCER